MYRTETIKYRKYSKYFFPSHGRFSGPLLEESLKNNNFTLTSDVNVKKRDTKILVLINYISCWERRFNHTP